MARMPLISPDIGARRDFHTGRQVDAPKRRRAKRRGAGATRYANRGRRL